MIHIYFLWANKVQQIIRKNWFPSLIKKESITYSRNCRVITLPMISGLLSLVMSTIWQLLFKAIDTFLKLNLSFKLQALISHIGLMKRLERLEPLSTKTENNNSTYPTESTFMLMPKKIAFSFLGGKIRAFVSVSSRESHNLSGSSILWATLKISWKSQSKKLSGKFLTDMRR